MEKQPISTTLGIVGTLSGMGFTIAIPIVVGCLVGQYLDGLFSLKPWLLLLGLLLGLMVGILGAYRFYKAVFDVQRANGPEG
jgi:ATP synthase protein I